MWTVTTSRSVRGVAIESYLFRNTTTCGCGFEIAVQIAVSVPKPFQRHAQEGATKNTQTEEFNTRTQRLGKGGKRSVSANERRWGFGGENRTSSGRSELVPVTD